MTARVVAVRQRLADPDLLNRLLDLGLRADDAAALERAAAAVLDRPADVEIIATLADRLVGRLGDFAPDGPAAVWSGVPVGADGVLPLLALFVTAPEVADWHARRGFPRRSRRPRWPTWASRCGCTD